MRNTQFTDPSVFGYKLSVDLTTYDTNLKQYRKWCMFGRTMNYLSSAFSTIEEQWTWFDAFDRIGTGQ